MNHCLWRDLSEDDIDVEELKGALARLQIPLTEFAEAFDGEIGDIDPEFEQLLGAGRSIADFVGVYSRYEPRIKDGSDEGKRMYKAFVRRMACRHRRTATSATRSAHLASGIVDRGGTPTKAVHITY